MSLRQRVERAQQGADIPNAGAVVPVAPPAPPTQTRVPAREALLREIRLRLQSEVVDAFGSLLEGPATGVRSKIEGLVDQVLRLHGFAVTRDEPCG